MKIEPGVYNFKTEFWPTLGISKKSWEERREDLLEWLTNFYEYELLNGRPIRIYIKEVIGEYQPLPRKINSNELTLQKKEDYKLFALSTLTKEFKPNSKAKTAREAIQDFGNEKYGHISVEGINRRYITPVFNEYAECNGIYRWVWYKTYEPLTEEQIQEWRKIMTEERISEEQAANAFYRQEQGEDISKEKEYFQNAKTRLKAKFGDIAIRVADWKLK